VVERQTHNGPGQIEICPDFCCYYSKIMSFESIGLDAFVCVGSVGDEETFRKKSGGREFNPRSGHLLLFW